MTVKALVNCRPFIEGQFAELSSVYVRDGRVENIVYDDCRSPSTSEIDCNGELLVPGLVDIQVNGGGGVLFNDTPTLEGLNMIAAAHIACGTTSFLPTIISDNLSVVDQAMRAVEQAISNGVPGIIGIHLEGPCLGENKAGVHDKKFFKSLSSEIVDLFSSLKHGVTLVTVAPEAAAPELITALTSRGVVVSLGHSNADAESTKNSLEAGATGFTHLYNAMSQFKNRNPGMVGTALVADDAWTGVIVDGHHVDFLSLQIAHRMKPPDKIIYVSDAMPVVGVNFSQFVLGDRTVHVCDGALKTENDTLAGTSISLWDAVRLASSIMGLPLEKSLIPATYNPAAFLGLDIGKIQPGAKADFLRLSKTGELKSVHLAND